LNFLRVRNSLRNSLLSLAKSKSARQATQIMISRFGGMAIGAVAQIYVARQLGPEKLGISGLAIAAVAQGCILASFGSDTLLVRKYRETDGEEEKTKLVETAFAARLLFTLMLGGALFAALPLINIRPDFTLSIACIIPLLLFQVNQPLWLLQAKEQLPALYLSNTISIAFGAGLIFIFIKPSSPAGSDMIVSCIAAGISFFLSWSFAIRGLPALKFDFAAIGKLLQSSRWLFASSIVVYLYTQFEQPLLGSMRSLDELGIYRSALQVVGGITPFIAMVSLLMYPKLIAWRAISIDYLWSQQKKIFFKLLPWVVLAIGLAFLALPFLYPWIFGPKFQSASLPCALLVASKLVVLLNGIFGWGLWALKQDRLMLMIMTGVAIFSVSMNFLTIPYFGMLATASVNLASELLILVACAWQMRRIITAPCLEKAA